MSQQPHGRPGKGTILITAAALLGSTAFLGAMAPNAFADDSSTTPVATAPAATAPTDGTATAATPVDTPDAGQPATDDASASTATPDATATESATPADDASAAPAADAPVAAAANTGTVPVHIFTFNDFHGRIDGTTNDDNTALTSSPIANSSNVSYGTAMNFAYNLENLYWQDPDNSMIVSAGDNIGASEFASASSDDQPTIQLLNDFAANMDFRVSELGNHEFDNGLAAIQTRLDPPANYDEIAIQNWTYIADNITYKSDGSLVFAPYVIYTLPNGVTVGVVGADTQSTPSLVTPGGIATINFGDPVAAVNKYAAQLKDGDPSNGEADIVIAVYHEGSPVGDSTQATLADAESESAVFTSIVNNTSSDVSAIVTGHTHEQYEWQDANGRPIIQTGCYGANVGQIDLTYNFDTKAIGVDDVKNNPAQAVPADVDLTTTTIGNLPTIDQHLAYWLGQANVVGSQNVGKISADITTAYAGGEWVDGVYTKGTNGTRDDRANESTMATLVANAFLWTANNTPNVNDNGATTYDIGIINAGGGLRAEMLTSMDTNGDGMISYAEANAVLPFANNLWTLSLTGAQFKQFLEEEWQTTDTNGTPYGAHPFLATGLSSNVTFTVNTDVPTATACVYDSTTGCTWNQDNSHITSVWINGQPLDPNARYNILTISFLPDGGGDNYRVMNDAQPVDGHTTMDTGLLDRDAWIDYLLQESGMSDINGTPTSQISPDFARQSVVVTNVNPATGPMQATTVTAGQNVSATLSRLDLTSLGSPANTTLDTYLVPTADASLSTPPDSALIGSTTVTAPGDTAGCTADGVSADLNPASNGCAKIDYTIPAGTTPGAYELVSIAQPSGTTVRMSLTVQQQIVPDVADSTVQIVPQATSLTGGTARLADGTDAYTVTVTLGDAAGDSFPGLGSVLFPVFDSGCAATTSISPVTDNGDSTYTYTITATTPGLCDLSVGLGEPNQPIGGPIPVNFLGATISAASATAGAQLTSEAVGFSSDETVTAAMNGQTIDLTTDENGVVGVSIDTTTLAVGTYTLTYTGSVSGTVTVDLTIVAAAPVVPAAPGATAPTGGTVAGGSGAIPVALLLLGTGLGALWLRRRVGVRA